MRYRCPRCGFANLDDVDLPKAGVIKALTLVYRTGPSSMVPAPYYVAIVDLDSGPTVEAISGSQVDSEQIEAGARVELVLESIGTDEEGEEVGAYRFAPARNGWS